MKASVIVCTRNPRPGSLGRLGKALRAQDAPPDAWERVVVDNGSEPAVDLTGFPSARLAREEEPGLTPARLRGIRESRGDVLIFFDDDNEPDPDYVSNAIALFREKTKIGTAGGRIEGCFEQPPPRWAEPYLGWLAIRPGVAREQEGGPSDSWNRLPCGAGFCIRADAAKRYAEQVENNPDWREFDRKGNVLTGSGDTQMALTALDMGYRSLLTPRLSLKHHIPASRLEADYLERLLEGSSFSTLRLALMRGKKTKPFWLNRLLRRFKRCRLWETDLFLLRLRMERAIDRGEEKALRLFQTK